MFKKIKKFLLVQEIEHFESDITAIDISLITDEKINFIYEQAVKYGTEIDESRKIMASRATLLLCYLITASAWLFASALHKIKSDNLIDQFFVLNAGLIVAFYAITICALAFFVLTPKFRRSLNNEPKNLLAKGVMSFDLKMIKFSEIENLQNRINANYESQQIPFRILKYSIIGTVIVPIILVVPSYFLFF